MNMQSVLSGANIASLDVKGKEKRIIAIMNTLAIETGILSLALGCLLYKTGHKLTIYPAMLTCGLFFSILLFKKFNRPVHWQQVMYIFHNLFIWYYGIMLGPAYGIFIFIPFLTLCIFWIFHHPLPQVLLLLATAIFWLIVEINYQYPFIEPVSLSPDMQIALHWIVMLAAVFFNGTILYHLLKENRLKIKHIKTLVTHLNKSQEAMRVYVRETTHEIRSPLNVVNSILQNYVETADPGKTSIRVKKNHLEAIYFACQDMQLVTANALGWSRIEAGKSEIYKTSFHFANFTLRLCDTYGYLAQKKAVHINIIFADHLPEYILTDKIKLHSIIVNLLSNAIKFTAIHSVITVTAGIKNGILKLSVSDQGPGISEERKQSIFIHYVSEMGQQKESIGLGLPIARHMAQLLGGNLSVADNPTGPGSVFTLTIPVEKTEAPQKEPTTPVDFTQLQGLKVLIIDDDPSNQLAISLALQRMGIEVLLAESGIQGYQQAQLQEPDVILVDMLMPQTSGTDLVAQFKADRKLQHIPVILVSGNYYEEVQEEVIACGADGFLGKPINLVQLYTMLKNVIVIA